MDDEAWFAVVAAPLFDGLCAAELGRLRALAIRLLADKSFSGAGGMEVEPGMSTVIAAFAALPVLNLGYDWYEGWREIVIYPGEFMHEGESWEGDPMVLSWQDVEWSGRRLQPGES